MARRYSYSSSRIGDTVSQRQRNFFEDSDADGSPLLNHTGRRQLLMRRQLGTTNEASRTQPAIELHRTHTEETQSSSSRPLAAHFALDWDKSCYFLDGKRQADYVLAYDDDSNFDHEETSAKLETPDGTFDESGEAHSKEEKKRAKRTHFEANLRKMGLELEERAATPGAGRIHYILVHAPFKVLEKQAQVLQVKLPVMESDVEMNEGRFIPGRLDRLLQRFKFYRIDEETREMIHEPHYFTAPYSPERRHLFVNHDRPEALFPNAERSRMVHDLLTRAHYSSPNTFQRHQGYQIGIERLVSIGVYSAAYPLHQELRPRASLPENVSDLNQREILYTKWASWRNWYKEQPLDLIKRYFGSMIGLYYAWLGYYTALLYPAAFLGVLPIIYGLFSMGSDKPTNEICNGTNITICPACDAKYCESTQLDSSCNYAKVTYVFDNTGTVIFAALMSIWATLFLEGWKRYHAEIAWKWGLLDAIVQEDTVRAEFQYRVKTRRMNPVTRQVEPYLTFTKRFLNTFASGSTCVFFMLLVCALIFGIVVYRVILLGVMYKVLDEGSGTRNGYYFVIVSSSTINLIVILIMNYIYNRIALSLTRWECPRTQADFDNSYTVKVFLFQFVNYYGAIFYVAFFKGVATQVPATHTKVEGQYNLFNNVRLEGCDAAGCFTELVILMAFVMVGRQIISGIVEMGYPLAISLLRRIQYRMPATARILAKKKKEELLDSANLPRWEKDYFLQPTYDQFLFDEYLEMVIQFGFVTLFVAAFPLAPLFALLNNIVEIRLDAFKFLSQQQRPMPSTARNIGIWYEILDGISRISVIVNGLVIAFSSDFIPKLVYYATHDKAVYSTNDNTSYIEHTMEGYIHWSLSYFNANDSVSMNSTLLHSCQYRGFRNFPCSLNDTVTNPTSSCTDGYGYSNDFWKILAVRLAFVVVFEHVVFMVKMVVEYVIPDIPARIFIQQQRERYLARKALLEVPTTSREGGESKPGLARSDCSPEYLIFSRMPEDNEEVAFQPGSFEDIPDVELPSSEARQPPAPEAELVERRPRISAMPRWANHSSSSRDPSSDSYMTARTDTQTRDSRENT